MSQSVFYFFSGDHSVFNRPKESHCAEYSDHSQDRAPPPQRDLAFAGGTPPPITSPARFFIAPARLRMVSEPSVVLETDYRDFYDAVFARRAAHSSVTVPFHRPMHRRERAEQFRILAEAGARCVAHGTVTRIATAADPANSLIVDLPAGKRHRTVMLSAAFARRHCPERFASAFVPEATHGAGPVSYQMIGIGASKTLFRCADFHPFQPIWRTGDGLVQMWEPERTPNPALYRLSFPFPLWQATFVSTGERLLATGFTTSPCWVGTELFRFLSPDFIYDAIHDWLLARRPDATRDSAQPRHEILAGGA